MVEISGFGDLQKQLANIQKEINKAIEGEAPLKDIFPNSFMEANTDFSSISEFFENSPFEVKTNKDYQGVDKSELSSYTKAHTKFATWQEFLERATALYTKEKLKTHGFDVE